VAFRESYLLTFAASEDSSARKMAGLVTGYLLRGDAASGKFGSWRSLSVLHPKILEP